MADGGAGHEGGGERGLLLEALESMMSPAGDERQAAERMIGEFVEQEGAAEMLLDVVSDASVTEMQRSTAAILFNNKATLFWGKRDDVGRASLMDRILEVVGMDHLGKMQRRSLLHAAGSILLAGGVVAPLLHEIESWMEGGKVLQCMECIQTMLEMEVESFVEKISDFCDIVLAIDQDRTSPPGILAGMRVGAMLLGSGHRLERAKEMVLWEADGLEMVVKDGGVEDVRRVLHALHSWEAADWGESESGVVADAVLPLISRLEETRLVREACAVVIHLIQTSPEMFARDSSRVQAVVDTTVRAIRLWVPESMEESLLQYAYHVGVIETEPREEEEDGDGMDHLGKTSVELLSCIAEHTDSKELWGVLMKEILRGDDAREEAIEKATSLFLLAFTCETIEKGLHDDLEMVLDEVIQALEHESVQVRGAACMAFSQLPSVMTLCREETWTRILIALMHTIQADGHDGVKGRAMIAFAEVIEMAHDFDQDVVPEFVEVVMPLVLRVDAEEGLKVAGIHCLGAIAAACGEGFRPVALPVLQYLNDLCSAGGALPDSMLEVALTAHGSVLSSLEQEEIEPRMFLPIIENMMHLFRAHDAPKAIRSKCFQSLSTMIPNLPDMLVDELSEQLLPIVMEVISEAGAAGVHIVVGHALVERSASNFIVSAMEVLVAVCCNGMPEHALPKMHAALPAILPQTQHPDPEVRCAAVSFLSKVCASASAFLPPDEAGFMMQKVSGVLFQAVRDEDASVAEVALVSFRQWINEAPDRGAFVLGPLEEAFFEVLGEAIQGRIPSVAKKGRGSHVSSNFPRPLLSEILNLVAALTTVVNSDSPHLRRFLPLLVDTASDAEWPTVCAVDLVACVGEVAHEVGKEVFGEAEERVVGIVLDALDAEDPALRRNTCYLASQVFEKGIVVKEEHKERLEDLLIECATRDDFADDFVVDNAASALAKALNPPLLPNPDKVLRAVIKAYPLQADEEEVVVVASVLRDVIQAPHPLLCENPDLMSDALLRFLRTLDEDTLTTPTAVHEVRTAVARWKVDCPPELHEAIENVRRLHPEVAALVDE